MKSPIASQLNTTFVPVSDLKKSVQWYSELLGQPYNLNQVKPPIYNLPITHHTGVLLDGGQGTVHPSPHPLFNFHTNDIQTSFDFVQHLGYEIIGEIKRFEDLSFFTIKDPDGNVVMVCNA